MGKGLNGIGGNRRIGLVFIWGIILSIVLQACISTGKPREKATYSPAGPTENQFGKILEYKNKIYEPSIRTVQFYRGLNEMSFPILYLGSRTGLTLEFDELVNEPGDYDDYTIEITHCNADWTPSNLMSMEYMEGFDTDRINDWWQSANTRINYIHYQYLLEMDNFRFKKSGNYLLQVYRSGTEEDLVITRRFVVVENGAQIEAFAGRNINPSQRRKIQTLNFFILPGMTKIDDPFQDLEVKIMQNGRWDNIREGIKPTFIKDNKLEYMFEAANEFKGGNEYRLLDIRTTRFYTLRVKKTEVIDNIYHVQLYNDKIRTFNSYDQEFDFNGSFFIEVQEYPNGEYEADYVMVDFRLKYPEPVTSGNIYVFGGLTDWSLQENFKMVYDPNRGEYQTQVLLKQGVYDHHYVLGKNDKIPDETLLEGSHVQTENSYTILVYYRTFSDRTDRLIGLQHINFQEER